MPFTSSDAKTHTKKAKTAKQRKTWASAANSTRKACLADGKSEKTCDARGIKAGNAVIAKGVNEMDPKVESPVLETEETPEADLKEGYYVDDPEMWSPATSFADLEAERETQETVADLRRTTADLMMMVSNVMWHNEIEPKVPALRGLFDEYLTVVTETLDEGPGDGGTEEGEPEPVTPELGESDAVDLAEHGGLLSVTEATIEDLALFDDLLAEQRVELTDPRRAPVLVNFAIIQVGHGNTRDKNYYPAETLTEAGPLFRDVDIFVTDHDPNEKAESTKVGRFRTAGVLSEDGLCSQAIIYDPDVAEKTRNRADAGELGTLHCSIFATGTGKPGTIDGQEVTVVESITAVHSVDLVSRAGAGGRAISLAENTDGGTMDNETQNDETEVLKGQEPEAQKTEVVEVAIVESDAEPEETPVVEAEPIPLVEVERVPHVHVARVAELVAASDLSEKAHSWVLGQAYETEEAIEQAIEEMRTFIADLTPAGQPFALGETTAVGQSDDIPKLRTDEELKARARENMRTVMKELDPTYAGNL